MSEIEGGGSGEVSSSSEVSETSSAETGGESSEATQEATTEEASESGGFDEDSDTAETPEDSIEGADELEPDETSDDSQEVGFSEGDDIDNPDSQNDELEYEDSDSSDTDENGVGFADSDNDDDIDNDGGVDDTDDGTGTDNIDGGQDEDEQTEDPDSTTDNDVDDDGNLDDADTEDEGNIDDDHNEDDGIIDDDLDVQDDEDPGESEDYSDKDALDNASDDNGDGNPDDIDTEADTEGDDNIDNTEDEGDHMEDTDSAADGDETNDDVDGDGNLDDADTDNEADTEDDGSIDNTEDEGNHTEDTDSTADGDETNNNIDGDGNLDGADTDNEADTEDDGSIDNNKDEGDHTEDTDSTADGDETNDDVDGDDNLDDTDTEGDDNIDDDYNEDEDLGEVELYSDEGHGTPTENNEFPDEYNKAEQEQNAEEPAIEGENEEAANRAKNEAENDASRTGENDTTIEAIDNQHKSSENNENTSSENQGSTEEQPEDTNAKLDNMAENPDSRDAYRTAMNNMADYMNEHNYGPDDYSEYSQDPEWQKLNADLQQSLGMEATTDTVTPSPESGKDVSATELPDNCVIVNASDIDMTYAQGMDSDQFWNHHGNTKEDYMRAAEKIPDVQQALDSGKSLDEIKQDPDLKDTASAYFDPENMIKVEQQADGSYSFTDDGRHRIAAAQEFGYEIPVEVTNIPENVNASNADNVETKPAQTENLEDVANKSDISNETRENLGAFEQTTWDNLSQAEKEQAVEKLRDSVAEDLQLENKPNVAYYNNEDPGDYGGYAASTNTIYINRFNMSDAAETADTIAHESRHCWQHERANNPQTEQDYQFKENFDDYVRPEDDFYEYQNQPVEVDARDYAQDVKDAIPTADETPDMEAKHSYERNDHKDDNDVPPSTTGPPEMSNTNLESLQVPDDLDRKADIPNEQKIAEVNKNIADISDDPSLDSREKAEKIAKELNSIGFKKVDTTTVLGFTDQKIEVVQMDGSQELYRRGYDTEGQGQYGYGSWWLEEPMSIDDTRNKLAVCKSWGNPLTGEYQSKPEKGTLALKGTAAPQDTPTKDGGIEHRDGGATQYYIETPNKNWCRKVN